VFIVVSIYSIDSVQKLLDTPLYRWAWIGLYLNSCQQLTHQNSTTKGMITWPLEHYVGCT